MSSVPRKRNRFRSRARRPGAKQEAARVPVVSGIFYPEERGPLEQQVDRFCAGGRERRPAAGGCPRQRVVAVLVPHGSYGSCGSVLGAVYSRVSWPETVVLIGPNHAGEGQPLGLAPRGRWATPLGELPVDEELARAILRRAKDLKRDLRCHEWEHALEVQLPFLQRRGKVRRIVPIAIGLSDLAPAQRIGEAVGEEILRREGRVQLVGSVNLTRCEPLEQAQAKDPQILERILALDGPGLLELASEQALSLCGAGVVVAVMAAARRLGASKGRLLRYQTSAEGGADPVSVVGYAGIVFQ
ncbi:MAG: AmmeMemoRadiSam system protein B [Candidatus Omnitrophica bacterium]|nr:AmmeMemoRadiSam system protein B [Candidatus Omnitrophota bacterium]